jgi:hypothetical protein
MRIGAGFWADNPVDVAPKAVMMTAVMMTACIRMPRIIISTSEPC